MKPCKEGVYVGENFTSKDFHGEDLSGAKFVKCRMHGVGLEQCDLTDVEFVECDLSHSKLTGAKTKNTKFTVCNMSKATVRDCVLDGAGFEDCNWDGTDFAGSTFKGNRITGIRNLVKANLYPIESDGVYFKVFKAEPFGATITNRTMQLGCHHATKEGWLGMTDLDLAVNTCGDPRANPEWKRWAPVLKEAIAVLQLVDAE